jgi:hypothetical protein
MNDNVGCNSCDWMLIVRFAKLMNDYNSWNLMFTILFIFYFQSLWFRFFQQIIFVIMYICMSTPSIKIITSSKVNYFTPLYYPLRCSQSQNLYFLHFKILIRCIHQTWWKYCEHQIYFRNLKFDLIIYIC